MTTAILNSKNQHYYQLVSTKVAWIEAVKSAKQTTFNGLYGYLLSVDDREESAFLVQTKALSPATTADIWGSVWLAISDSDREGSWVVQDGPDKGKVISYSNWYTLANGGKQEPNNYQNAEHNAVADLGVNGYWNDISSTGTFAYIIEFGGLPASYTITPSATSVNEGSSVTFTIDTKNVEWGKTVSYTLTGISQSDLASGSLTGSATVNQNGVDGRATVTITLAEDQSSEGLESLRFTVGPEISPAIVINDTSMSPSSVELRINSVGGRFGLLELLTQTKSIDTAFMQVVKFGGLWTTEFRSDASDLLRWHQASLQGNRALDGLTLDQALSALERGLNGPDRSSFVELVGLIADTTIRNGIPEFDGNLLPPPILVPSYLLKPLGNSVNEGASVTVQVTSWYISTGTVLSYSLSGQGIFITDIVGSQLSGKLVIDGSGQGNIKIELVDDMSTEGPENLVVTLEGKTVSVIVNDTSFTPGSMDITPPALLSTNPQSGSKDVAIDGNIALNFNETIAKGAGVIQLTNASGLVVESFDVQMSPRLTWVGSQLIIDPTANLAGNQLYRFVIPKGAIDDLTGNDYAGTIIELTTVGQAGPPPGF